MEPQNTKTGPIMRLFQVQAHPGCADELIRNFATTSADVVQHEPGNKGFFFGQGISQDKDFVVFASFWKDLDAVKTRFGKAWQSPHLPPGYDRLIKDSSVRHVNVGTGWNVSLDD